MIPISVKSMTVSMLASDLIFFRGLVRSTSSRLLRMELMVKLLLLLLDESVMVNVCCARGDTSVDVSVCEQ